MNAVNTDQFRQIKPQPVESQMNYPLSNDRFQGANKQEVQLERSTPQKPARTLVEDQFESSVSQESFLREMLYFDRF